MSANENNASIEDSIKEALKQAQKVIKSGREYTAKSEAIFKGATESYSLVSLNTPLTQTLQPYTQKLQAITEKVDNKLKIAEYILEYINTSDTLKIVIKAGSNILNSVIFAKGVELSKDMASVVLQSTIRGKTPLGIAIFVSGGLISYSFAEEIEELAKDLFFGKNNIPYRLNKKIEDFFTPALICPPSYQFPNGNCTPSVDEFF